MTRVVNYNPPLNMITLMKESVGVRPATKVAKAGAYPSAHTLRVYLQEKSQSGAVNLRGVASWMIKHGPAAWRDGSRKLIRNEINEDIGSRTFSAEFWKVSTPTSDKLEITYPDVETPSPWPPTSPVPGELWNSKCTYERASSSFAYSSATENGWPPLPGWKGSPDGNGWFVDEWHAQRALITPLPKMLKDVESGFVIVHLVGWIKATSDRSGLRCWFCPALASWADYTESYARWQDKSCAHAMRGLVDNKIILPPPSDPWTHTEPINLAVRVTPKRQEAWMGDRKWLALKISAPASRGIYRHINHNVKVSVNLTPKIYYPAFL